MKPGVLPTGVITVTRQYPRCGGMVRRLSGAGEDSIPMEQEIRDALEQAYTGEAKAALRLKVFADVAEKEGYPQIAKLFRVISFS